ncbi:hypothetical protein BDZ91DRAFT_678985 [Kalaharituber pfeilii]|nr:hypothetical protein BDZ91DRAFT_678985 [Kalaharituber pfeilii]
MSAAAGRRRLSQLASYRESFPPARSLTTTLSLSFLGISIPSPQMASEPEPSSSSSTRATRLSDPAGSRRQIGAPSEIAVPESSKASGPANDRDEDDDEDDEDDEPKLKYTRLTKSLGGVYRNGDAVSSTWVGGDKLIVGTHNGNIHILSLPSLHPLRTYKAHSASITSISVSPPPPPPPYSSPSTPTHQSLAAASSSSANIFIGTSSIDGHVCITPLSALLTPPSAGQDPRGRPQQHTSTKEILLKNFSRPLLSVALSPNYASDKLYLTGGLSTNLILSQHDKPGSKLTSSTVTSSGSGGGGWGLPIPAIPWGVTGEGNAGKDVILASGEGPISLIKFSRESPRYVAWACESGVKIMRSHILLHGEKDRIAKEGASGAASKHEWKRICAIERPESVSEEMAGVIKARVEWIDRRELGKDPEELTGGGGEPIDETGINRPGWDGGKERLVVGWGGTVWVMNVYSGEGAVDESRLWGWGEIVNILQTDCTISGLSLYTPSQLLLLAYITAPDEQPPTEAEKSLIPSSSSVRRIGGISGSGRRIAASPELRIISLATSEEISADSLMMSRFESLTSNDYHLNMLPATPKVGISLPQHEGGFYGGASEFLAGAGAGLWAAGVTATTIFSSAASVRSFGSSGGNGAHSESSKPTFSWSPTLPTFASSLRSVPGFSKVAGETTSGIPTDGWGDVRGQKIYITSPYDVVFATERGLKDHLGWLLEKERYAEAWELVDKNPETVNGEGGEGSLVYDQDATAAYGDDSTDGEDDDASVIVSITDSDDRSTITKQKPKRGLQHLFTPAEKEKRRIGELWITKLVSHNQWAAAGEVCGKVLNTSSRWEHWVFIFQAEGKINEITNYIPRDQLVPPLSSGIYEIVLAHWLKHNRDVFQRLLLEDWGVDKGLFDLDVVADLVRRRIKTDEEELEDIRQRRKYSHRGWKFSSRGKDKEDEEEAAKEAEVDADWRMLQLCLAKLCMAMKNPREALGCYMRLKAEPEVMSLIKDYYLMDAVKDEIAPLLMLKLTHEQLQTAPLQELQELTAPAVDLLVAEAGHGIVGPEKVIQQLDEAPEMVDGGRVLLFFYLRKLWEVDRQLVEESWADLAMELWAEYDRPLLMEFLKASQAYSLEKAAQICETRNYIPELVHLLSKTGQTKKALYLIIDKLHDVAQAIAFAKQQDEKELWDDLISYSMDKPDFVRGLLENVGVSSGGNKSGVEVVKLVRGIPEGLRVEGLKGAIQKVLREYAIQYSVAEGVARVLRGEVHAEMDELKRRSRRGVKFEIGLDVSSPKVFLEGEMVPGQEQQAQRGTTCSGCQMLFAFNEKDTLLSFPCGHIFHLRCLLTGTKSGSNGDTSPQPIGDDIDDLMLYASDSISSGRSVGAKVTHAALLKEKLVSTGGKCLICQTKKEEEYEEY